MHLRSWQWLERSHVFLSFWTLYTIVNTNRFSRHLVSVNLRFSSLYLFISNLKNIRNFGFYSILSLLIFLGLTLSSCAFASFWDFVYVSMVSCHILCSLVLCPFSRADRTNKIGPLSASTLPVLYEGGQNRCVFSVSGILQECHHWSNGEGIWCYGGIHRLVSFPLWVLLV